MICVYVIEMFANESKIVQAAERLHKAMKGMGTNE